MLTIKAIVVLLEQRVGGLSQITLILLEKAPLASTGKSVLTLGEPLSGRALPLG